MQENNFYKFYFDNNKYIEFRLISNDDSIQEITKLLHKAYKSLADKGLKYLATYQDDDITLERIQNAYKCFVGIYKGDIVATVSLYSPKPSDIDNWYNRYFVAKFGQFAVLPELQGYGIGSRMIKILENDARKIDSVTEIALDTSEKAHHLIDYYIKRGYRYIETVKWDVTNYNSIIYSKTL